MSYHEPNVPFHVTLQVCAQSNMFSKLIMTNCTYYQFKCLFVPECDISVLSFCQHNKLLLSHNAQYRRGLGGILKYLINIWKCSHIY